MAPNDDHCPITPTRSLETPEGIRTKKSAAKDSLEYSHVPKSCCLVSTVETAQQTQHSLKGITKRQRRPKSAAASPQQ